MGYLVRMLLLAVLGLSQMANANELDAQAILDCAAANGPEKTFTQQANFVTFHPDESQRSLQARVIGAREDNSLGLNISVEAPSSMAGTVVLFKEKEGQDTTRIYLPSIMRAQNVSGSMAATKVLGTDFSYLDVKQLYGAFVEGEKEYLSTADLGDRRAHKILIIPQADEASPYARLETHIDLETCVVLAVSFLSEGGDVLKRLEVNPASIQAVEEHHLAHEYTMFDLMSGTRTTVKMSKIVFDPQVGRSVFHTQMFMGAKH